MANNAGEQAAKNIKDASKAIAGDPISQAKIGLKLGCGMLVLFATLFTIFFSVSLENNGPEAADTTISGDFNSSGGDLANADAITLEELKELLSNHSSGRKLKPYAEQIYRSAHAFNINPLLALAMANHDSQMGTRGAGETCRNPGNISKRDDDYTESGINGLGRCSDVYGGSARWEAFQTYGDGMQGMMWLLRVNYLDKGLTTPEAIVHKYAPSSDGNNEKAYADSIKDFMRKYGN